MRYRDSNRPSLVSKILGNLVLISVIFFVLWYFNKQQTENRENQSKALLEKEQRVEKQQLTYLNEFISSCISEHESVLMVLDSINQTQEYGWKWRRMSFYQDIIFKEEPSYFVYPQFNNLADSVLSPKAKAILNRELPLGQLKLVDFYDAFERWNAVETKTNLVLFQTHLQRILKLEKELKADLQK